MDEMTTAQEVGNAVSLYFPAFAGIWLAIAMVVVAVDVLRRVFREHREDDKKLGK